MVPSTSVPDFDALHSVPIDAIGGSSVETERTVAAWTQISSPWQVPGYEITGLRQPLVLTMFVLYFRRDILFTNGIVPLISSLFFFVETVKKGNFVKDVYIMEK